MTPEPIRNTRSIDWEKPTRNGLASRGSSCWMNEESLSGLTAPPPPPPAFACWRLWMKAALVAGSPVRDWGFFSAAWNSGVGAIVLKALAMRLGTAVNRMDRKMAVPRVPPI
jgi:hypothetical protein